LFKIARALLPKRLIPAAMTHRPTELAIGMAVDQLFADLPKATRKELGDLPTVVARLEGDAQKMRALIEELQEIAGESPDIRAMRDDAHKRLMETVAALETIRLGLLRLKSGVGSIASMTTGLHAAREVGEAVDRLLAGQREVDELLRKQTPTPV
jgi:methyl-accepting chemotaxis protein